MNLKNTTGLTMTAKEHYFHHFALNLGPSLAVTSGEKINNVLDLPHQAQAILKFNNEVTNTQYIQRQYISFFCTSPIFIQHQIVQQWYLLCNSKLTHDIVISLLSSRKWILIHLHSYQNLSDFVLTQLPSRDIICCRRYRISRFCHLPVRTSGRVFFFDLCHQMQSQQVLSILNWEMTLQNLQGSQTSPLHEVVPIIDQQSVYLLECVSSNYESICMTKIYFRIMFIENLFFIPKQKFKI